MKCKYSMGNKVVIIPSHLEKMSDSNKYKGVGTVESSRIQGCWNSLEEIDPNFKWEEAINLKDEMVTVRFKWEETKITKTGKPRKTKKERTVGVPAIYLQEVARC